MRHNSSKLRLIVINNPIWSWVSATVNSSILKDGELLIDRKSLEWEVLPVVEDVWENCTSGVVLLYESINAYSKS